MKLLNESVVQELTFKYDSETEKKLHEDLMIRDGFHIEQPSLPFLKKPLTVTYSKRKQVDNIARL